MTIDVTEIPHKDVYVVRIPKDNEDTVLSALEKLFGGLKHGSCVTLAEDDHKALMDNVVKVVVKDE